MARQSGLVSRDAVDSDVFYSLIDAFGDNLVVMAAARQVPLLFKGKQKSAVQFAASLIAPDLNDWLQPYAAEQIAKHKSDGRKLMLVTAMPAEVARPIASKLGFEHVLATEFSVDSDGKFDGGINGHFVWSEGKSTAVLEYAKEKEIDLDSSWAYSDSRYDTGLLSSVGHPVAVNPDQRLERIARESNWEIVTFDDASGVDTVVPSRAEAQQIAFKVLRPELLPFAEFDISGVESVGDERPVILACAPGNPFDWVVLALTISELGKPLGFVRSGDSPADIAQSLGNNEMQVATGSPWTSVAEAAAIANADVYVVKIEGSEAVWPHAKPLTIFWNIRNPPAVSARVEGPLRLGLTNASDDAAAIAAATA